MLIIRKILYVINILLALLLLCTYLPAFVPQDILSKISLLGYVYPFALVGNLAFVLLWLVWKPKNLFLSLVVICLRIDYIPRLVNYSSSKAEDGDIKVLTYNVKDFVYGMEEGKYIGMNALSDSIVEYVASTGADVLCFQDYDVNTKWKHGFHYKLVDSLGYNNFYYYHLGSVTADNVAIYSKYKIVDCGSVAEDLNEKDCLIYADIRTNNGVVRVYNLHLKSYMLGKKEKNDYKDIVKGNLQNSTKEDTKNIIDKLLSANRYRAVQTRYIIAEIEKVQLPVIICGDFNDHPFSNTYRKFTNKFSDSFVSKGRGVGGSYNGPFPMYRIDYILFNKNRLECVGYETKRVDFSDHYPIVSTFKIKKQ